MSPAPINGRAYCGRCESGRTRKNGTGQGGQKWRCNDCGNQWIEGANRRHRNGVPMRLLDVLETDGVWANREYLANRLDVSAYAVDRALYRLRRDGLVESRPVQLIHGSMLEWRTV